jgi:threonine dehydratase
MSPFSLADLEDAVETVRRAMPATPTYAWPLLRRRTGVDILVKHENHTPIGSFKLRGGLVYLDRLKRQGRLPKGLVTATRGNHGQSVAFAASRYGIPAVVVVPEGNSSEKNAAISALGGELVIAGRDFDESRQVAATLAQQRGYLPMPPFASDLVLGVATYAYEMFLAAGDLAAVYVPIGMGSGICGVIGVRDLLGLETQVVGVVADGAPAFALSVAAGQAVWTDRADTFADGLACRQPQEAPLAVIRAGAARILRLAEDELAEAIRALYADTHNVAEGAGAAALAGAFKERHDYQGQRVGVVLSGGNIDADRLTAILA